MELVENIQELIEATIPGESSKFPNLGDLRLETKYVEPLVPTPYQLHLLYRKISPKDPVASLVIVHGFGEHSGKYMALASYMALRGFEVHTYDWRGQGRSTGVRGGHDMYELQQDLNKIIKLVREDLPCFIYGHSLGGLLVTTMLINNPHLNFSGVIISSPMFWRDGIDVSWGAVKVAEFVYPVFKDVLFTSNISIGSLSRDMSFLRQAMDDRLFQPYFGISMGISMAKHLRSLFEEAPNFKYPSIFCHGSEDKLTSPGATKRFFERCGSQDKNLKIVEGARHELHQDVNRDEFIDGLYQWMSARIKQPIGNVGDLKIGHPGMKPESQIPKYIFRLVVLAVVAFFVNKRYPSLLRRLSQ